MKSIRELATVPTKPYKTPSAYTWELIGKHTNGRALYVRSPRGFTAYIADRDYPAQPGEAQIFNDQAKKSQAFEAWVLN